MHRDIHYFLKFRFIVVSYFEIMVYSKKWAQLESGRNLPVFTYLSWCVILPTKFIYIFNSWHVRLNAILIWYVVIHNFECMSYIRNIFWFVRILPVSNNLYFLRWSNRLLAIWIILEINFLLYGTTKKLYNNIRNCSYWAIVDFMYNKKFERRMGLFHHLSWS